MKAVLCRDFGPIENLRWEEVAAPPCGAGQIRFRTTVATLGFMDQLLVRGLYQHRPALPFVPGAVSAGVVTEVGAEVKGIKVGDRVTASDYGGAFATERVVGAADVNVIPEGIEDLQSASGRLTFLPAYLALFVRSKLEKGETLVVTGATGGTGYAALMLGREVGARVIGAVGSADKAAFLRAQGFTDVVDYGAGSFKDQVNALTGGKGADVILDVVGGDVLAQSLRCINTDGRILIVGFAGGKIPEIPANLPLLKNAAVIGSFLGGWRRKHPERFERMRADMERLMLEKNLHLPIAARIPMSRAVDAMQMVIDRKAVGVVALEP